MQCYYREKKYICGNYIDLQIYPVFPVRKIKGRRTKMKPTSEIQQRLNDENANRKLSRYINANFQNGDYMLTLTYAPENVPADERQAKRDMQNFLRRVKRRYEKNQNELKYIWVMEKSKKGRIHFHCVMTGGIDRTELERIWGLGFANTRALQFSENGVEGLVKYYTKDRLLYRRFNASKNLSKPIERQNDSRISKKRARELYNVIEIPEEFKKLYPEYEKNFGGFEVGTAEVEQNELNGQLYFSIRLFNWKAVYGEKRYSTRLCNRSFSDLFVVGKTDNRKAKRKNNS